MYSNEDLERFYFRYQTEALPHGTSLQAFCLNNNVPYNIFSKLSMDILPSTLDVAHHYNGGFNEHTKAHPKREQFFLLIEDGESIKDAVDICLRLPFKQRVVRMAKRVIKKSVKCVLSDSMVKAIKKIVKR